VNNTETVTCVDNKHPQELAEKEGRPNCHLEVHLTKMDSSWCAPPPSLHG